MRLLLGICVCSIYTYLMLCMYCRLCGCSHRVHKCVQSGFASFSSADASCWQCTSTTCSIIECRCSSALVNSYNICVCVFTCLRLCSPLLICTQHCVFVSPGGSGVDIRSEILEDLNMFPMIRCTGLFLPYMNGAWYTDGGSIVLLAWKPCIYTSYFCFS